LSGPRFTGSPPTPARQRAPWRRIAHAAALLALLWLIYRAFVLQPSNDRDWEYGMDRLAGITIRDGSVLVQNVRDFRYTARGVRSSNYLARTFEAERLERVWFVEETFTIGPFDDFNGIAHTYFVFDFREEPPVAISVEARRERGETYDIVRGALNQYELIYLWGAEDDLTVSRAVREKNRLYMYPLTIPIESARELFLQMARDTQHLETQPRFYNSLTSNCTTELAKAANKVQPGAIPPNIAVVLPGYSDEVLYDLGYLPGDVPLAELTRRSHITDLVLAHHEQADFSRRLRSELRSRWRATSAGLNHALPGVS
jgi:hypothetical protein